MAQHPRGFLARRPLSGAQDRRHRLPGRRLKDQDRLKAIPAARRVEETELLPAVHEVCRVIDVQHDLTRRAGEAVAKGIDHAQPHPGQPTAFSSRDRVGCEASPTSASGDFSQNIFNAGS